MELVNSKLVNSELVNSKLVNSTLISLSAGTYIHNENNYYTREFVSITRRLYKISANMLIQLWGKMSIDKLHQMVQDGDQLFHKCHICNSYYNKFLDNIKNYKGVYCHSQCIKFIYPILINIRDNINSYKHEILLTSKKQYRGKIVYIDDHRRKTMYVYNGKHIYPYTMSYSLYFISYGLRYINFCDYISQSVILNNIYDRNYNNWCVVIRKKILYLSSLDNICSDIMRTIIKIILDIYNFIHTQLYW